MSYVTFYIFLQRLGTWWFWQCE